MAYMLTRTVAQGRRSGSMAVLGINDGSYVHLAAAVRRPVCAVLASTTAFTVVKWVGAAYLCYLGLRALLSRNPMTTLTGSEMSGRSLRRCSGRVILLERRPQPEGRDLLRRAAAAVHRRTGCTPRCSSSCSA